MIDIFDLIIWSKLSGGGSGSLPAPTSDGVALIGVNGEWKQQEGYGYEDGGLNIEWDGDPEGHTRIGMDDIYFYKVSDRVFTADELFGVTAELVVDGETEIFEFHPAQYGQYMANDYAISGCAGHFEPFDMEIPEAGTYFVGSLPSFYLKKISSPSTITTIDPKFIPKELPEATENGTALVYVDGEWKTQEGYGYETEPAFEPIEWDGNTEGRASINEGTYFKVAEELDITALDGSSVNIVVSGHSVEHPFVEISELMTDYYAAYYGEEDTSIVILTNDIDVGGGIIFEKGVYFPKDESEGVYCSELTPASTIHPISPSLLPMDEIQQMIDASVGDVIGGSY